MSVRPQCLVNTRPLLAEVGAQDLAQRGMAADRTGACWRALTWLCGVTLPPALELEAEQVLMGLSLPVSGFINISQFLVVKYLLIGRW